MGLRALLVIGVLRVVGYLLFGAVINRVDLCVSLLCILI